MEPRHPYREGARGNSNHTLSLSPISNNSHWPNPVGTRTAGETIHTTPVASLPGQRPGCSRWRVELKEQKQHRRFQAQIFHKPWACPDFIRPSVLLIAKGAMVSAALHVHHITHAGPCAWDTSTLLLVFQDQRSNHGLRCSEHFLPISFW